MDIAFRVRNVEVPDSVRHRTREKVTRLAAWCGLERADVCFSCERNPRATEREVCAITLFGNRHILRAEAAAVDTTVAAERVVGQLEQRAKRLRGRLGGRRARSVQFATIGPAYAGLLGGRHGICSDGAGEAAIMDKGGAWLPMTPEAAAFEMTAAGCDVWLFANVETGYPGVLYRRRDGDIAVTSPSLPRTDLQPPAATVVGS